MRRLVPVAARRRLSSWLRRRGFKPDAHYRIRIEYPTSASNAPRWKPHTELERLIAGYDDSYRSSLEVIQRYGEALQDIDMHASSPGAPAWINEWLPVLDAAALYAFIRSRSPARYVEIGSGFSTRFAARAKRDGELATEIVSIDPRPRAEVDDLCDRALRTPLETADTRIFGELSQGDVLFFDGTHRTFMNSDATVFFLEVLPSLRADVLVGVHDVFLPYDYPEEFADRYYSEQYLLAAQLLARSPMLQPVLPTYYVGLHAKLGPLAGSLGSTLVGQDAEIRGTAFWLATRAA